MEKRILVVEDDRALNEGIAFALRREGYLTNSAYSLRWAREKLEELRTPQQEQNPQLMGIKTAFRTLSIIPFVRG